MAEYVNFYENLKEAEMRLSHTVVMYDGEPYYVLAITNHHADGIFRIYLDQLGLPCGLVHQIENIPYDYAEHPSTPMTRGQALDDWLASRGKEFPGVIRKQMNSPLFNKFRPFPLGMCNYQGKSRYLERLPTRYTQQGLTQQMLIGTAVRSSPSLGYTKNEVPSIFSSEFYDTIKGNYPSFQECLRNMTHPDIANESTAFHREFALVKGPLGLLFLSYKHDIVGFLPNGDDSVVMLSAEFRHLKEVTAELNVFFDVRINNK